MHFGGELENDELNDTVLIERYGKKRIRVDEADGYATFKSGDKISDRLWIRLWLKKWAKMMEVWQRSIIQTGKFK